MIKSAMICTAIVIAAAAPIYIVPRVMAGNGGSVGPVRPAYHCQPACQRDPMLMPPRLPPVRNFGVEHYPAPVAVPAPPGALLFVPAVLALLWLRRGPRPPSRRGDLLRRHPGHPHQLGPLRLNPRRATSLERRA